ncbi:MAG: TonB-dependent receptor [Bacteroidota bacterium]
MRYLLSCLSLFCLFPLLQAQETQTIRGTILDAISEQPIPGVTVVVTDLTPPMGAISDSSGKFRITNVPVGRHGISCKHINYAEYRSDNLILNSVRELIVDVKMEEVIRTTEGVDITPDPIPHRPLNAFSPVSMRSFSVEETQRYAGTVNDPSRMAMGFAGVQASQDNNSDIIIRGNSPTGLLWRLEGIDIPNPNHFARKGSSGGGISVFSAQLLGNSDFSTGAFSAEYGNATSGVFDMKFRHGNVEQREHRFKFGLLGTDLAAEGPIKKGRSSYLVNYRYSTLGILNDLGFRLVGPRIDNNFQDLSFNLYFPSADNRSQFTVFGIGGLSSELWDPSADSLIWSRPYRSTRDFLTDMGAAGATYRYLIDDRSFIKAVVAISGNRVVDNEDTLNISTVQPHPSPDTLHYPIDWRTLPESRFKTEEYTNSRLSGHIFYQRKMSARSTLKVGVLASQIRFSFKHQERITDSENFQTLVAGRDQSSLLQSYVQFRFALSPRLNLNAGVHGMTLLLNNTYAADPRVSLSYQAKGQQTISAAYGLHSQIFPLGSYFTEIEGPNGVIEQPNLDLDMLRAHHLILGYEKVFGSNLRLNVEGYYQALMNVPVTPSNMPTDYNLLNERDGYATVELVNEGTGTNLGVDITLEKFFTSGFFFLWSGSLFDSKYVASDGNTYNSRFNSRYNTSLMLGVEKPVGEGNTFQAGMRGVLNGGLRYTPGNPALSRAAGMFVPQAGATFSESVGVYARIDLRVAYRWNRPKTAYILSLDVQNTTNRINVRDQVFDPGSGKLVIRGQSGLVPVISFQVDF